MTSAKQIMLNAYQGIHSDRIPVAPEFGGLYAAKMLGVDMIQLMEIPLGKALQEILRKFGCEGWSFVGAEIVNPNAKESTSFNKINDEQYERKYIVEYNGHKFESSSIHTKEDPSWKRNYPVKDEKDLASYIDMRLDENSIFHFGNANDAYQSVAQDYLLEFYIGDQFFDFIAQGLGFEKAVYYFLSEDKEVLEGYYNRYVDFQKKLVLQAVKNTSFEAFFICCSYACNSLEGPVLWRQWDKPYLKAMADEVHKHGKLLHVHLHGRILETVSDLAEIGLDCVCPFERYPGDVNGLEGLKKVRKALAEQVTFNGNVSTVEALIRGSSEDVRREVREIREAFKGSPRLIIGTGDQVGRETPEENLWAMIDEARRK